jgi:hypothetical protein
MYEISFIYCVYLGIGLCQLTTSIIWLVLPPRTGIDSGIIVPGSMEHSQQ